MGWEISEPVNVEGMFDDSTPPARGRGGGKPGKPGIARLLPGKALRSKGNQEIPPGDRLWLEIPGGGGFGDPFERDPARVAHDVAMGLVSPTAAEQDYGVIIAADGRVDEKATRNCRERKG